HEARCKGGDDINIGVWKVAMAAPNDVSELAKLIDSGSVDPASIVALIGKTEGNGGANDFTRGYATLSYQLLLARYLRTTPEEIGKRGAFVWSGGTEGGLSDGAGRLAMCIGITRDILPEEVGTMIQVREVSGAVKRALGEAEIDDP